MLCNGHDEYDAKVNLGFEKSEGKFWGATAAPIQTSFNWKIGSSLNTTEPKNLYSEDEVIIWNIKILLNSLKGEIPWFATAYLWIWWKDRSSSDLETQQLGDLTGEKTRFPRLFTPHTSGFEAHTEHYCFETRLVTTRQKDKWD